MTASTRLCPTAAGSQANEKNLVPMNPTLGIDMAQLSFVAALVFDAGRVIKADFPNHAAGFRRLGRWLATHGAGQLRVGLESTSTYGEALAHWLHEHGHSVYLLNPERVA